MGVERGEEKWGNGIRDKGRDTGKEKREREKQHMMIKSNKDQTNEDEWIKGE